MKTKYIILLIVFLLIILSLTIYAFKGEHKVKQIYDTNSPSTIGYLELTVSDLERSVDYYQEVIGFKVLEKKNNSAILTADGETPLLSLNEDEEAVRRPNGTTGLFHFAILLPTRHDLALYFKHLAEKNYAIQGASDHLYSEAIYLADPDGNGIEIYADKKPDTWKTDRNGQYITGTYRLDIEDLFSDFDGGSWSGLPLKSKVGHMHLQVSDLKEAEEFYVNLLNFDVVTKDVSYLFVSKDRYHHHIGMNTWAGVGLPSPPENSLGLSHYTIHLTQEDYESVKENLSKANHPFEESNGTVLVTDPFNQKLLLLNNKNYLIID